MIVRFIFIVVIQDEVIQIKISEKPDWSLFKGIMLSIFSNIGLYLYIVTVRSKSSMLGEGWFSLFNISFKFVELTWLIGPGILAPIVANEMRKISQPSRKFFLVVGAGVVITILLYATSYIVKSHAAKVINLVSSNEFMELNSNVFLQNSMFVSIVGGLAVYITSINSILGYLKQGVLVIYIGLAGLLFYLQIDDLDPHNLMVALGVGFSLVLAGNLVAYATRYRFST